MSPMACHGCSWCPFWDCAANLYVACGPCVVPVACHELLEVWHCLMSPIMHLCILHVSPWGHQLWACSTFMRLKTCGFWIMKVSVDLLPMLHAILYHFRQSCMITRPHQALQRPSRQTNTQKTSCPIKLCNHVSGMWWCTDALTTEGFQRCTA